MHAHPHHHRGRFRNRYSGAAHGPGWDLLKFLWQMRTQPPVAVALPRMQPDVAWLKANRGASTLTWIGHASFLLQIGGLNILTDPHLTGRASPFHSAGPKRLQPPALDFADLPPIDVVVISHNHYDHLDLRTVRRLAQEHDPQFFVPLGLKAWFTAQGIQSAVTELDWWNDSSFRQLKLTAVPVQHFSGRSANDRNKTLWCGFVLECVDKKIIFAGDTGYSPDFKDIAGRFGAMDLALIPIGAYEPRSFMRPVHVNPEEAVKVHQDLQSRQSVAMHWGTFRLTLEPPDEPPRRLLQALKRAGIAEDRFWVMRHGETRRLSL